MNSTFTAQKGDEIKDTNFGDFIPSVHRNMAWDSLAPYERPAINQYLKPYLGDTFVTELIAHANTVDAAPDTESTLDTCLYHFRLALSWYMTYDAFIDQNVQLTDLGPQQQSASQGGSNAPSQWAFKTKRWNLIKKADTYIDQLLDYLNDPARTQDAGFSSFTADAKRRRQSSDFFASTTEVDEFLNIEGSRRAWANMVPSFRDAEWLHLKPALGQDFYDELKTMYADRTATAEYAETLKKIQRVIAKFGLMLAIPNLSCVIQGDGIVMVSRRDGFDERVSSSLVYNQSAVARLQQSTEGLARTALADLKAYIYTNADALPTYKNSTAYPTESDPVLPIGDEDSGAIFL